MMTFFSLPDDTTRLLKKHEALGAGQDPLEDADETIKE